jgi:hypothetical protein
MMAVLSAEKSNKKWLSSNKYRKKVKVIEASLLNL